MKLLSAVVLACAPLAWSQTIYTNANVYTVDDKSPKVDSFCVGLDGRFVATGPIENMKEACSTANIVDLAGATVVPGFVDAHAHLMDQGFKMARPQLDNCTSVKEVVSLLQDFVRTNPVAPGSWLQGFGWDQNLWDVKEFPVRQDLDAAFPNTPVYLERIDGHSSWANTAAINAAPPLPDVDPAGGVIIRDDKGVPTGVFTDNARVLITQAIPDPTLEESSAALELVLAGTSANGLTTIHNPGIDDSQADLFKLFIDQGRMKIRQYAMWLAVENKNLGAAADPTHPMIIDYGKEGLLDVKAVKFFMDGALGSWGAALLEPYTDKPNEQGSLRMTIEDFHTLADAWHANGYQLATHAIGDRANRIVIDKYRQMCQDEKVPDLRLRIEHFQIVNVTDIPRIAFPSEPNGDTCILASMQPTHATSDMPFAETRLGPERVKGAYAWQKALASGTRALAFGSDFPTVGLIPPLLGMYAAVTRRDLDGMPAGGWFPDQIVSREQALRSYTIESAYAAFQEDDLGSIAAGKRADFVVLDRDIMTVPDEREIWQATILQTFLGGKAIHVHDCYTRQYEGKGLSRHLRATRGGVCKEATQEAKERAIAYQRSRDKVGDGCPH